MKRTRILVSYLLMSFLVISNMPYAFGGEYHQTEYQSYEPKQHEYHHQEHHPPPAKKSANVDINIPLDFGTMAKFGILGLTQLKLLGALAKVATAGLGVGALGLSQLGKIGLHLGGAQKGGIAIDIGAGHHHHHSAAKSHSHYEPAHYEHSEKHY